MPARDDQDLALVLREIITGALDELGGEERPARALRAADQAAYAAKHAGKGRVSPRVAS